jgi:hypothetical protein
VTTTSTTAPITIASVTTGAAGAFPGQRIPDLPRPPSWDHAVTVHGGPRGAVAELAELVAASRALDDAGEALRRAAVAAARLTHLVDASRQESPATAQRAAAACAVLTAPGSGLGAAARDAEETAAALRDAASGYLTAEQLVERLVRAAQVVAGHALGAAGPGVWLVSAAAGASVALTALQRVITLRVLRRTPTPAGFLLNGLSEVLEDVEGPAGLLGWLLVGEGPVPRLDPRDTRVLEGLLPLVGGFAQGALPGGPLGPGTALGEITGTVPVAQSTAAEVGWWLSFVRRRLGVEPRRVMVARSVVPPPPAAQAPPRGVADLVEGIGRTYPPKPGGPGLAPPGTVEVKQLARPDGSTTWVVTIPGTQEWGPLQGPNPFDLTTNLDIMAREAHDVATAVERAMRMAGIPAGEPIVLAGHSQGGLAAAAMAADPVLRERFSIGAVVTAGAPVGTIALPPDVVGIHLEHGTDLVTALDAQPNPDTPRRTTVRTDLGVAPDPAVRAAAGSPPDAHDIALYAVTAGAAEVVDDVGLRAARAQLGELLDGGTTVETTWYTAVRVPEAPAGGRR